VRCAPNNAYWLSLACLGRGLLLTLTGLGIGLVLAVIAAPLIRGLLCDMSRVSSSPLIAGKGRIYDSSTVQRRLPCKATGGNVRLSSPLGETGTVKLNMAPVSDSTKRSSQPSRTRGRVARPPTMRAAAG
jgi:hypothetical protein